MKTFISRWSAVLFALLVSSVSLSVQTASAETILPQGCAIVAKTDKSPLSYRTGEGIVFTFTADLKGTSPAEYSLRWLLRSDDGKKENGSAPADKPLTIKTKLDRPGFVNVDVTLVDAAGKPVRYHGINWGNPLVMPLQIFAGAAAEPEKLSDCGEPADFDAFWAKQKAKLSAVPFAGKVEMQKVDSSRGYDVYAVSIPCAGPRPATGFLQIPVGAKEKSLPAILQFYGYGTNRQTPPHQREKTPAIVFWVNAHGQPLMRDKEFYVHFFKSIRTEKYTYAMDPEENKDPETAFFNGMALRALRAAQFVKTLPQWNGKDLIARGSSQAGLQTMWVTALDPSVTEAYPYVTWCCDLAGTAKAGRVSGPWRLEYLPALDYYDPVFMAKRIKKAKVEITRAGLGDYTCPPSGLAICYKNLATPRKSIRWVQGSNHGFVPEHPETVIWKSEK